jgi:hypothetical protein
MPIPVPSLLERGWGEALILYSTLLKFDIVFITGSDIKFLKVNSK